MRGVRETKDHLPAAFAMHAILCVDHKLVLASFAFLVFINTCGAKSVWAVLCVCVYVCMYVCIFIDKKYSVLALKALPLIDTNTNLCSGPAYSG